MATDPSIPPEECKHYLGSYGPWIIDSGCNEPVCWGFKITAHLGKDEFQRLRKKYRVEYCGHDWFLITKKLSREEAIRKYGPITGEEFGPYGGWKSVTFGSKRFLSESLKKR